MEVSEQGSVSVSWRIITAMLFNGGVGSALKTCGV